MVFTLDFNHLTSVEDSLKALLSVVEPVTGTVKISIKFADNRVLSRDIPAPRDFPHYDLCVKDGYAVKSAETKGCNQVTPVGLRHIVGSSMGPAECIQVHSGSALPTGSDAIAPIEIIEKKGDLIIVKGETKPGEFVKPRGSVVRKGDLVYRKGKQLKPTDVAMLLSLGITSVEVYEKPRVLIIPTGDELIEAGSEPGPGFVNESNGLMCAMFAERFGGQVSVHDIVPDNLEALVKALKTGLDYDLIVTSGGTSVGARDHIHEAVSSVGEVLVHGIAIKPGKPAGIGYMGGAKKKVAVMFLPGFPEACAANMMAFIEPAVCKLGHYYTPIHPKEMTMLEKDIDGFSGTMSFVKITVDNERAIPTGIVDRSEQVSRSGYTIITGIKPIMRQASA